jgi:ppGpp synthetase/RelA/SpoT-type nucleotidyltranferase
MSCLLFRILSQAKRDLDVSGVVQTRTKDISSFAEKAVRKRSMYPDAIRTMDDLCGGRVIATCKDDIDPICQALQMRLRVVQGEDAFERLAVSEFGYRSVHFIVSFDPTQLLGLLVSLGPEEFSRLVSGSTPDDFPQTTKELCAYLCQEDTSVVPSRPRFRAEIQVRSLLQHAWAEFSHDRFYKSGFTIPPRWQRMLGRIAAAMETADDDFAHTCTSLDKYRTYYGAYLSRSERESELANLIAVLKHDNSDVRLACRASRMVLSLGQFGAAEEILQDFADRWDKSPEGHELKRLYEEKMKTMAGPGSNPNKWELMEQIDDALKLLRSRCTSEAIMDYGWSTWNKGDSQNGRRYLEWAAALDPGNTSASVFLAQTYLNQSRPDVQTALKYYAQAFERSSTDPEILAGFLYCKLRVDGTTNSLSAARAALDAAIEVCRERIGARVDLPQALYRMGLFLLFLGKPYEALNAYAKAVILSESGSDVAGELDHISQLQGALKDALPELEWVRRLLLASQRTMELKTVERVTVEIAEKKAERDKLEPMIGPETDDRAKEEIRGKMTALDQVLLQLEQRRENACSKAQSIVEECRSLLRRHCWTKRSYPALDSPFLEMVGARPIVIVAGGCSERHKDKLQSYGPLFASALEKYDGIVMCGCTDAGVNKLVGDLCLAKANAFTPITFEPELKPSRPETHKAFEDVIQTDGKGFNALDSIMSWMYIHASGKDPSQVKLLGVNGGPIAAFEFRMALAMGAKVGILRDSGRAAAEILDDQDWKDTPGLLSLPNDGHTVRLFLCGFKPSKGLAQHREQLAMTAHEQYLSDQRKALMKKEANWRPWPELPDDLKNSNRQQVDFIEDALHAVGLTMRYVGIEKQNEIHLYQFSPEQADLLAEMEHARWNVERLLAGWRFGLKKDVEMKVTPYLVSWSDLPEEIREWDYGPVRDIPGKLRSVGYEIIARNGSLAPEEGKRNI